MPQPRKQLIQPDATPYYHLVSRCVRQQFLCGFDALTRRDFSHRRGWIKARLARVAEAFAIDVHAYAIMSNHFHVVVGINEAAAKSWSEREVAERWQRLFKGPDVFQRYCRGERLTLTERIRVRSLVALYRGRLMNISWFMRAINEPIARMANAEDGTAGHFWQGRFKSQALLSRGALLSAMIYVDLNPVRAGMVNTPEQTPDTSAQDRVKRLQTARVDGAWQHGEPLSPVMGPSKVAPETRLPYALGDYVELLDWSGRVVQDNKRGAIPRATPSILSRIGIRRSGYVQYVKREGKGFRNAIGSPSRLRSVAGLMGRSFMQGHDAARQLFSEPAPEA